MMDQLPPLWGHQARGRDESFKILWNDRETGFPVEIPGFGFFMEMGTGKSRTLTECIRHIANTKRKLPRVLIFTPPLVVPQFKADILKFSRIESKQIVLLQDSGKKRLQVFMKEAFKDAAPVPRIFITNYESVLLGGGRTKDKSGRPVYSPGPLFLAMQAWKPELIACDESHLIKSHEALRSQQLYRLANPQEDKPKTYVMTGSPVLNNIMDLFMQVKVMLGGWPTLRWFETSGRPDQLIKNFYHFRARYFRDANAGMAAGPNKFQDWRVMTLDRDGVDAEGEIREILSRISLRVMKSECLDLPEEISKTDLVGMTTEQSRMYREMKNQLITYLHDKACVAKIAITKALRLLQITAGFVSLTGEGEEMDPVTHSFPDTPKEERFRELIEELTPNNKVLVWAVWKENYGRIRQILDKLGVEYVEAHGEIPDGKKRANVQRFQTDPKVRVFLGHPGSGGVGLNLVQAPYSIFYSRTFSLAHYLQARSRNHRGGAKEQGHANITHIDLACQGTIDELVLERLAGKIEIGEKILQSMEKELASQEN